MTTGATVVVAIWVRDLIGDAIKIPEITMS